VPRSLSTAGEDRIFALRAQHWTQSQIAVEVGLSQGRISQILNARSSATGNGLTTTELLTKVRPSICETCGGRLRYTVMPLMGVVGICVGSCGQTAA